MRDPEQRTKGPQVRIAGGKVMEPSVGNAGETRPGRTFCCSSWVNPANNGGVNHCKSYKQLRILIRGHAKMTESLETTPLAGICKMKKEIHLGAFRKKKKRDNNLNTEQGCVSCLEDSKPYIYKDLLGTPVVRFKVVGKTVVTIILFFWSIILRGELQHLVSTLIMWSHHLSFKGNSYAE